MNNNKKTFNNLLIITLLFFVSLVIVNMSELNIFSTGGISYTDSSVFRTIALQIKNGLVPYKDTFDHKGPLIYLINLLGLLINENYGIWIVELFFVFVSLLFLYKITRLYTNNLYISLLSIILSSSLFYYTYEGGNLVEEYAVLFLTISLYIFLQFFKLNSITNTKLIIIGSCFMFVFLLRPNMVFTIVLLSIYVAIQSVINKQTKEIFRYLLYFCVGMILVSAPILIWLISKNAFNDFLYDFIVFNGKYVGDTNIINVLKTTIGFALKAPILITILVALVISFLEKDKTCFVMLICICANVLFISISGRSYAHYAMILLPLLIYPYLQALLLIEQKYKKLKALLFILLLIVTNSCVSWGNMTINTLLCFSNRSKYSNDDIYEIASVVRKITNDEDEISVWGNENILYLLSNRLPASKYSYQFPIVNIDERINKEYMQELNKNIPIVVIKCSGDDRINQFLEDNYYEYYSNNVGSIWTIKK